MCQPSTFFAHGCALISCRLQVIRAARSTVSMFLFCVMMAWDVCEYNLQSELLFIDYFFDQGAWLIFCFIVFKIECRGCSMPENVTTATHIVTLNSSGFWGTHHGKYDLVIIDVHARKELYFIVHKLLSCEMKIYHVGSCMNNVFCTRYTVISTLFIFRLCLEEFAHHQCLSSV